MASETEIRAASSPARTPVKLKRKWRARDLVFPVAGLLVIGAGVLLYPEVSPGKKVAVDQAPKIPPASRLAVLSGPHTTIEPTARSAVAWMSGNQSCYGLVNLSSPGDNNMNCVAAPGAEQFPGAAQTAAQIWSKPHFITGQQEMTSDHIIAIGFVAGPVHSVTVTLKSGYRVSAPVVPVPDQGSGQIGSYVAALPMSNGKISWADISTVIAFDDSGRIMAHI